MRVVQLSQLEMESPGLPPNDGRPIFTIEGPVKERRVVDTPWGEAWAEVGTYVATNETSGAQHIIAESDLFISYRELS